MSYFQLDELDEAVLEIGFQAEELKTHRKTLGKIVKDLRYPEKIAITQSKKLMEEIRGAIRKEVKEIISSEICKALLEDRRATITPMLKFLDSAEGVHARVSALQVRLDDVQDRIDRYWDQIRDKSRELTPPVP